MIIAGNKEIANAMNSFFVNIGSTVEIKIPSFSKHFSSYLKDHNHSSIFLLSYYPHTIQNKSWKFTSSECTFFSFTTSK